MAYRAGFLLAAWSGCVIGGGVACVEVAEAGSSTDAAGRFDVRWWTTDDGLPETPITGIALNTDGTLLCASRSRLVRFDGMAVEPWPDHLTRPLHDEIGDFWSIGFDGRGRLWVQGRNAVACLEERIDRAREITRWKVHRVDWGVVTGMPFDADGLPILVGANFVCPFDGDRFVPKHVSALVGGHDTAAEQAWRFGCADTRAGEMWLWGGMRGGPLVRVGVREAAGEAAGEPLDHQPAHVVTVGRGPDGPLALLPDRIMKRTSDRWVAIQQDLPDASTRISGKVVGAADGTVWVSSHDGLLACRNGRIEATIAGVPEFSLYTHQLLTAPDGSAWAACSGGLLMVRRMPFTVEPLPACTAVHACVDGSLLVGASGGVWRRGGRDDSPTLKLVAALPSSAVPTALLETDDGTIWVGTQDAFLFQIEDGVARQITQPDEHFRELRSVNAIVRDAAGRVWAGTTNGLAVHDSRTNRFELVSPHGVPTPARVIGLTAEADGGLVVATAARGVERRGIDGTLTALAPARDLPGRRAVVMHRDSWGTLWVGGERGLLRISEGGARFHLSRANGLVDDEIRQIDEDPHGRLWIVTRDGHLQGMQLDALERLAAGREDIVRGIVAHPAAALGGAECRGRFSSALGTLGVPSGGGPSKNLLVPFESGLIRYATPAVLASPAAPAPNILVQPADKGIAAGGFSVRVGASGMHLDDPPTYQVRLDPIEGEWSPPTSQASFAYPALPAGRYTFFARRIAGETGAEFPIASIEIDVPAPWWRRPSTLVALLVLLAALAAAASREITRFRDRRRIADLERQRDRDRDRARIARDIHDSLGAGLTRVALMSEIARQQASPGQAVDTQLDLIYRDARALARAVDEIVWAVNPANDTLAEFTSFVMQDVEEFARAGGLRLRLDVPTAMPAVPVEAHVRHHVCLCVREAVRNVLEHADATSLGLTIRLGAGVMRVVVDDDGRGFSPLRATGDEQDGLANMRTRMQEIGGRVSIESSPGHGARVTLFVPVANAGDPSRSAEAPRMSAFVPPMRAEVHDAALR